MSDEWKAEVGEADFTLPLLFLGGYATLLALFRWVGSWFSSSDSGWLYSLFSLATTSLYGCALFTLGYFSYLYLMHSSSSRSSRKKRALGASARVGRQQAAAVLAALAEKDAPMESPKERRDQETNLLVLLDEVTMRLQGLEMALNHLPSSISEEAKERITQFLSYVHSLESPWAAEEKRKEASEKAKLMELLCDKDPFATLTEKRSPRTAAKEASKEEPKAEAEAEPETKANPDTETQTEERGGTETETESARATDASATASGDLSELLAGASTGGSLGFDLSGLGDDDDYEEDKDEKEEKEEKEEREAKKESSGSSAADDLMAALMGGSSTGAAPFEFGSEFAGLTDLSALTKSLGASAEGEESEEGSRGAETAAAAEAEVEEEDEWASLDASHEKVAGSSAKDDLLGALGALNSLSEGATDDNDSAGGGFSLGDVDLSALNAFATTSDSSLAVDSVDLSALDSLSGGEGGDKGGASADFGDLSSLSDLLAVKSESGATEADRETKGGLSYDDFFSAIQPKAEEAPAAAVEAPPRAAGALVRAFGSKEDMNLSGMKRSKKKAVRWGPGGKGKPVYQMEDTHYTGHPFNGDAETALFGVFDGHVGKHAAEKAKVLFPEEFAKNLRGHEGETDMAHVLRKTFLSTDAKMIEFDMEGATATGVYIWKVGGRRYLQAANVGDSNAFLCRNGKAIWLSVEHKVNDPAERERLLKAGMQLSEGQSRINGLAVSRALGDHFVKEHYPVTAEPFISEPFVLEEGDDKLIVASDGLWDIVSGQEAMDIIKDMSDPTAMAAKLTETAVKSRLCNDNVTVIVVLL
eukprot:CAMPEP_0114636882 /NCGR_PEP_ID=MMETSP0168-20121206/17210_1 /TAXON_ID=95228 ORGANISM="Vannella sp., Strain DIVA3 517/6/12" /NCGR_SAMPLE_ID=MMETSP0168 /ASSEMBLY_ACC=CAM_ASM_000044 /LENGTH=815 /DNA_ID=CAMNT_0001848599 /DNA_START=271 /DNA_END=2718 /DNA_ORIENTATION=-